MTSLSTNIDNQSKLPETNLEYSMMAVEMTALLLTAITT